MWDYAVMTKIVKKFGGPTKALCIMGVTHVISLVATAFASYEIGKHHMIQEAKKEEPSDLLDYENSSENFYTDIKQDK